MSKVEYLYNPDNDQVFNATANTIKEMRKLNLMPCPEAVLRAKRPELFKNETAAATVASAAATPEPPPPEDPEAVNPAGEGEFLSEQAKEEPKGEGLIMDPNRLTLLVEAIGELDPETDFTKAGVPVPAKLSAKVGGSVSAEERDFAWAEYQRSK